MRLTSWLSLFSNPNAQAVRSSKARRLRTVSIDRLEALEDRALLSAAQPVSVTLTNGNLTVDGTGYDDTFFVRVTGTNQVTLVGALGTTFTGAGGSASTVGPFNVSGSLTINTGNGDDSVLFVGVGANATLNGGKVSVDLGAGNDGLFQDATSTNLRFTNSLTVMGGLGNDSVRLGNSGAATQFTVANLTIDNETDNGGLQSIILSGVTVNGNVSLTQSGTGSQQLNLGYLGGTNSIRGNLTVTQSNTANVGGTLSFVTGTSVGGNFALTNGPTMTVNNTTIGTSNIAGSASIIDGNAAISNTITVGTSTVGGILTVQNGTAITNQIFVDGSTLNGKSNSFSNGSAIAINEIHFGLSVGNTFAGAVAATNSSAIGVNNIFADKGSFNGGATFSNKLDGALSNIVSLGNDNNVGVQGNLVITNGASVALNAVTINRTATGGKNGDVTIANGATNTTAVTLGNLGQNIIAGDLKITNQATVGTRTTSVNTTSVGGKTGFSLFNIGVGDSVTSIGSGNLVTVLNAFKMQDGSGVTVLDIGDVVLGSLNFADLGGGQDTIDIGGDNGGNAVIVGVARITTGDANDIIRIATQGSATLNDSLYITLGAGDDAVVVGDNAVSPAFNAGSKFAIDGGLGLDSFTASEITFADYQATLPGKYMRTKVTNFESYADYLVP